jgi:NAD(P)H-flavin reductase
MTWPCCRRWHCSTRGCRSYRAVSDEPAHDHGTMYGTVPELAAKATWADREIYISGPDHMIVKTARVQRERGAPDASSTTTWTRRPARASSPIAGTSSGTCRRT